MADLRDDEMEDYRAALKQHGRSEAEFEITVTEPPHMPPRPDITPSSGRVRVRNRLTGSSKGYATGNGTAWVARLGEDLAAGAL